MAALQGPNLGVNYGWSVRESGWHTGMDANLKLLDAVLQLSVKSRAVATPPGSPANGDRYIVASSPTGAWAGKASQIAVRIEGAWTFVVPKIGWTCFIEDESVLSAYKSTGWSAGLAPDLPTIEESLGLKDFDLAAWTGVFGPAGLPPDVVQALSGALQKVLSKPEVREKIITAGAEPTPSDAASFRKLVARQLEVWGKKIADAGIEKQ